jgi:hypothetical protein
MYRLINLHIYCDTARSTFNLCISLHRLNLHHKNSLGIVLLSIIKRCVCGWGSTPDPLTAHAATLTMLTPYNGNLATPLLLSPPFSCTVEGRKRGRWDGKGGNIINSKLHFVTENRLNKISSNFIGYCNLCT